MTDIIIKSDTLNFILSRRKLMKDEISVLLVANYKTSDVEKLPAASDIGRVIEINKNFRIDQRMLNFIAKSMGIKANEVEDWTSLDFDNFMSKIPRNMIAPGNPGLIYIVIKIDPENRSFLVTYVSFAAFFTNVRISISEISHDGDDYGLRSTAFFVKEWIEEESSRKSFSEKREEYKYIRDAIRKQVGTSSSIYKFYEKVVENMKDCDILKMEEVLDPKHFNAIKEGKIKIEPNHCWSNSYAVLTSPEFDDIKDEMFYCEGFADDGNKYPIEHGWLRYKDMYFDPTAEMIYPGRTVLKDYTSIIEIPYEEAKEMIETTGQHGYNNLAMIAKLIK